MTTDDDIIATIDTAFGRVEKPEHFTNFSHCEECAEHDATLRRRDRSTLQLEDVNNPGWDPLCFSSAQGKAYYMPSLVRFALGRPCGISGTYWEQLLFHLEGDGANNDLIRYCDQGQRKAVASFLAHIIETRTVEVEQSANLEELFRAHGYWSEAD